VSLNDWWRYSTNTHKYICLSGLSGVKSLRIFTQELALQFLRSKAKCVIFPISRSCSPIAIAIAIAIPLMAATIKWVIQTRKAPGGNSLVISLYSQMLVKISWFLFLSTNHWASYTHAYYIYTPHTSGKFLGYFPLIAFFFNQKEWDKGKFPVLSCSVEITWW